MPVRRQHQSKQTVESSGSIASHRPERRRSTRGGLHGEPSRSQLIARILGSYAEMPGLSLQLHQAARLFGLREETCLVVLSDLVRDGRLRQSPDGQYRPPDGGVI
jgi:DNA-binding transcriptional LysR family regulator